MGRFEHLGYRRLGRRRRCAQSPHEGVLVPVHDAGGEVGLQPLLAEAGLLLPMAPEGLFVRVEHPLPDSGQPALCALSLDVRMRSLLEKVLRRQKSRPPRLRAGGPPASPKWLELLLDLAESGLEPSHLLLVVMPWRETISSMMSRLSR